MREHEPRSGSNSPTEATAGTEDQKKALPSVPDHELLRCIGSGSYGEVWLARNVMGTYRAVKVVYRRNFKDDRPYEREFKGIKKFEPISRSHMGLVQILHVGRNDLTRSFFYIMELADDACHEAGHRGVEAGRERKQSGKGGATCASAQKPSEARLPIQNQKSEIENSDTYVPRTLRFELHRRGRLPYQDCLAITLSLARTLEHLHGHGLIHRDIKPSNLVFVNGVPKLADIGLVTDLGEEGSFVGTEGYVAPEGPGSPAGDVYSLGKVLYEMVTGRDRLDFPELPTELDTFYDKEGVLALNEVIIRACSQEVRRRYRNANELRADLEALLGGLPIPSAGSAPSESDRGTLSSANSPGTVQTQEVLANSVAVLPFLNMSADTENEFLVDGITEDLITALSQVKGFHVPARTSSFAFKGKNEDIRRIGQMLSVANLVEGSVRKQGNRLRITAQLVKVADGFHLWSNRFDRELSDVFEIQDDIARSIAKALQGELAFECDAPIVRTQTHSTEAYQLYLKGREYWNERGAALEKALRYFELALLEDPTYTLALTGLADTQILRAFYAFAPAKDVLRQAKGAIEKVLAGEQHLAEAHSSFAMIKLFYDQDLSGAEESFRRALVLNPNYVPTHYWYGTLLAAMGRENEALSQSKRSLELDPLGPVSHAMLGWNYLLLHQYENATTTARRTLELRPNWVLAKWILGQAICLHGSPQDGVKELEEASEISKRNPLILATLSWIYAFAGDRERALALLAELAKPALVRVAPKLFMAMTWAALNDTRRSIKLIEKARRDGEVWVPWLRTGFGFGAFVKHPLFQEQLSRLPFK